MTESEWRTKFSEKITSKMNRLSVSQRELSRLTNIPDNTLSRYINGKRTPKVDAVINIARALECGVTELIQFGETITK